MTVERYPPPPSVVGRGFALPVGSVWDHPVSSRENQAKPLGYQGNQQGVRSSNLGLQEVMANSPNTAGHVLGCEFQLPTIMLALLCITLSCGVVTLPLNEELLTQ